MKQKSERMLRGMKQKLESTLKGRTNLANTIPPSHSSWPQQRLRERYSEDQIRLYFFPYRKRPIGELITELLLWLALVVGLVFFCPLLYIWFTQSASLGQITANSGFFAISATITIIDIYVITTKITPVVQKLQYEASKRLKEKKDLQMNPPPTELEYEEWINDIADEVFNRKAYKKLHISTASNSFGDLQVRTFVRPLQEKSAPPKKTEAAKRWAYSLGKMHYSIYTFTRLFVMENYIAIYTDTVNVRDQKSINEKFEHFFHQHVTYVSLEIEGTLPYPLSRQLSLILDSGKTIKLDIASANFWRCNSSGDWSARITDANQVHTGLLEVLNDHKMSVIRSINSEV